MIAPFSVPAIWMPTRFHDIDTEPGTRCNLAGCENYVASDRVLEALAAPSPDLVIDHWDSQDSTLRRKLADAHGIGVDQVLLTSGATGGIRYAFEVFADTHTHIGLLTPDWPGFRFYAERTRGKISRLHCRDFPFHFDVDDIIDFVRETGIDFVITSNPSAVTGRMWSTDEIEAILIACPETLFVIDEADAIYPRRSGAALTNTYSNALFIGSFSKFYGLSGLRIGYLISPDAHADHLARTISPAELTSLSIIAAHAALEDGDYQFRTQQAVERNLLSLQRAVDGTAIRIAPNSQCFAAYLDTAAHLPDLSTVLGGLGVDIVAGRHFGLDTGGRINLSNPALIDRLIGTLPEVEQALAVTPAAPE
ncbi:aminotransferase class I/II-fold pyridoxal phosphate-dependent enzyme [Streptomyces rimosus]